LAVFYIIYAPNYVSSDEKGILKKSVACKTGQDLK
jgi:hypothetical protein